MAVQSDDWMRSLISPAEGANPHVLLEGQSGSGKSLAARHIAFERMRQGQEVSVVDTHEPEKWGGAKQVFQGTNKQAGEAAADFLRKSLEMRKAEASAAKMRGEVPDFKPMTIVFSDFARMMKDVPQLGEEFKTLLTEARKFRISIVADTTALTGATSGIKGIKDVLDNFGQKVKFYAPTPQGDPRRAEMAGKTYETPQLPEYKERVDPSLVKPPPPPPPTEPPFDPALEARKRLEAEKRKALVDAEYAKLRPPPPPKGAMGAVVDALDPIRGMLGGTFGRLVGAGLDVTKALTSMTGAAAGAGVGLAAIVPVAGAVVAGFTAITGALDNAVKRYGDVSPAVAQAQAQAEIKQVLNDIRRGQQHGAELARYVESQARMQEKYEELKMKFLMKVAPIIEAIFEMLGPIMDGIGMAADITSALNPLKAISSAIGELVSMQRDTLPDVGDPVDVILRGVPPMQVPDFVD